jgi:hypothetical protein
MKKLRLISAFGASFSLNAQLDTLTEFFTGTPAFYLSGSFGYATGNNDYGDLAKMMLFDSQTGITGTGSISSILASIPRKSGTGNMRAIIWENTIDDVPGAELGSVTIDITDIDTNSSAFSTVGAWYYNVNATFTSPILIPANGSFWAGFELPPNAKGLIAIRGNTHEDFPLGKTHTGEFWEDGSFYTFGDEDNWAIDIAMMIFPAVDMVAGVNQNVISAKVYPNPANGVLNISINEEIESVLIVALDGKVVTTSTSASVNIGELVSGMHIYEIITTKGNVAHDTFMKY